MNTLIKVLMSERGWIANLYFEGSDVSFHDKETMRTEMFSLRAPARGLLGFNFGRSDNRFLGIQIYYANFCMISDFTCYSEYFRDDEPIAVIDAQVCDGLCWFKLPEGRVDRNSWSQTMTLQGPVWGTAVIDFNRDDKISGIELIGFNM